MNDCPLSDAEQERYGRQIGPGVLSPEGQARLRRARVLVTRVGGMGGPAAQMLVAAGVGHLTIAHGGPLLSADLNRQILGSEAGIGQARAPAFAACLRAFSRFAEIEAIDHEPDDGEAVRIARRSDLIVSCPPTFEERLRLNAAAAAAGIPLVDAAQWGMTGSLMVLQAGRTACLRCLYPEPPPFEDSFPVVGAISAAIGSLAALEAIKILSGDGQPQWGRLLTYDGFHGRVVTIQLARRGDCPCCVNLASSARTLDLPG